MKVFLRKGRGIKEPRDFNGQVIKEGDVLTTDTFDDCFNEEFYRTHYPSWSDEDIKKRKHTPTYKVKWNPKGFFYGVGISKELYLHDFRFKHTKKVIMDKKRFLSFFDEEHENYVNSEWEGDNAFSGLMIIAKYINPKEQYIIIGVGHDQISSVKVDALIENGIGEADAKELARLNWAVDLEESGEEWVFCFV